MHQVREPQLFKSDKAFFEEKIFFHCSLLKVICCERFYDSLFSQANPRSWKVLVQARMLSSNQIARFFDPNISVGNHIISLHGDSYYRKVSLRLLLLVGCGQAWPVTLKRVARVLFIDLVV